MCSNKVNNIMFSHHQMLHSLYLTILPKFERALFFQVKIVSAEAMKT